MLHSLLLRQRYEAVNGKDKMSTPLFSLLLENCEEYHRAWTLAERNDRSFEENVYRMCGCSRKGLEDGWWFFRAEL